MIEERWAGRIRGLMMALCASLAVAGWAGDAAACEPGHCVRVVAPGADAGGVATDARVWLFYSTTPGSEPEVSLVEDATGQIVLTSVDHFEGGGIESDEVRQLVARVEPLVGLSPGATYRVVVGPGGVCGAPTVRFTTGPASESPVASFGGASAVSVACLAELELATDCDDGDVYPRLRVTVDADAPATDAAGYRLYRDGQLLAVSRELPVTLDLLPAAASGTECFSLKAFNVAGVEDGNSAEVCVDTTAASCDGGGDGGGDAGGGDAGEDAGAGGSRDAGQGSGEDAGGAAGPDAGVALPDGGGAGASPDAGVAGAPQDGASAGAAEGGCAQVVAAAASPGSLALLGLLVVGLIARRRRRP